MKSDRLKDIKTHKIGDLVCVPTDDYFVQRINAIMVSDDSNTVEYRLADRWFYDFRCKLVDEEKFKELQGKIKSDYILKKGE